MSSASRSTFNLRPTIHVVGRDASCVAGWESIVAQVRTASAAVSNGAVVIAIDCYPGVDSAAIVGALQQTLQPAEFLSTESAFKSEQVIDRLVAEFLTDDPVFGYLAPLTIRDFLDADRSAAFKTRIVETDQKLVVVVGVAAAILCEPQIVVYADLTRWEALLRFRGDVASNLGVDNRQADWRKQYKRGFFVDWRVADRHKRSLIERWDYVLDTHDIDHPRLVTGEAVRDAFRQAARQPFSVVPYFDPAPWGGHWMQQNFGLDTDCRNFGWCFNCVPEENSLLFKFGEHTVELPALDLVFFQPRELLGSEVYRRFGAEFPIRFDFLDTMGGGNLSLQVHPTTDYMRRTFGMPYTQDESYYFLRADPDACVFLGLKEGISRAEMLQDLAAAERGDLAFDAERYVNQFPAHQHDHVLIPAGTVHCQGANSVVLEISATPYLFTFKLWDWQRAGLDGKPRPVHLQHGAQVIDWSRTTAWVRENLVNTITPVAEGDGWREERTGLHPDEPLETRRHWFTGVVPHNTEDTVNVLCLVEGDEIIIDSPESAFDPLVVHFAETVIVPAAVGPYRVRPHSQCRGTQCVTIKAFVRRDVRERH